MKRKSVILISKVLTLLAVAFVSTASLFLYHRPEIPAELKRN
jgi:cyclic lactone autoinducer peptide